MQTKKKGAKMSYKSPIEVFLQEAKLNYENSIYNAIQEYGIKVDKEELIKALSYDRKQYIAGYNDAIKELMEILTDMQRE